MPAAGASSHKVKRDRLRAVSSTSVSMGGDAVWSDPQGRHCEVTSWERDSWKEGGAVARPVGSSVLRRSGDWSNCPEGAGAPRSSGESGTWCSGRWKVKEGSAVSLWVTSASSGWNESQARTKDEVRSEIKTNGHQGAASGLRPYLQPALGPGPLDWFGPVTVDPHPGQRRPGEATAGATGRRSRLKQDPRVFLHLQTAEE